MAAEKYPVEIVVCLGSSCYARGNADNLVILKKYAENNANRVSIHLTGSLCQEQCKLGPNLVIAGEMYHSVNAARLRELLQHLPQPGKDDHGTA